MGWTTKLGKEIPIFVAKLKGFLFFGRTRPGPVDLER
jgi:hypothetical protein